MRRRDGNSRKLHRDSGATGERDETATEPVQRRQDVQIAFARKFAFAILMAPLLLGPALAAEIKIALIDPLSGPFAAPGINALRSWQLVADIANRQNWGGQHTFTVVGFDGKGSPQESLTQLKHAMDQGYRYIAQGGGSGVGLAFVDALEKHNERNHGKEAIYLNYAALDPDMTGSKCSFWHFRFDANSDMKTEAITASIARDKAITKVYVIGQNYALGQQVSRAAKEYLKRKRPDIEIVGDDLHPIGSVKDFSPYIAKIKASGAQAVITGNWGPDLALLVRAAKESGLEAVFYTLNAHDRGVAIAVGEAGVGRVRNVSSWSINNATFSGKEIVDEFKRKYQDDYVQAAAYTAIKFLAAGVRRAGSIDPVRVAAAMEGMKLVGLNGDIEMRGFDHQAQQAMVLSTWTKANGKDVQYDQENTGLGWKIEEKFDAFITSQPSSCRMKRPGG
jgi:branched-chain amino acid transport system substrate-binding protein